MVAHLPWDEDGHIFGLEEVRDERDSQVPRVTEMTFLSIVRRSLISNCTGRQRLASLPPGHPGVLSRAAGYERFRDLTACSSCPVLGEMCDFGVGTFRQKIERCAEGGGDGGLTRAATRAACGLPEEDVTLHQDGASHVVAPRPGAGVVETVAVRQVLGDEEGLVQCHVSLVNHCLERGWDFCSEYHVSRLHQDVWPRVPARDHVGTLRQPKARGWWKELPPRGRFGAPLIPRIPMERRVLDLSSSLCWTAPNPSHTAKTLSADLSVSCCECVALVGHLVKLEEACDAKANHRGRGVVNAMDVVEKKKWVGRESPETPVAPGVDDRRALPGRGCRNGQYGRPLPGRDDDREPRA